MGGGGQSNPLRYVALLAKYLIYDPTLSLLAEENSDENCAFGQARLRDANSMV